jgi:hypothetical protein
MGNSKKPKKPEIRSLIKKKPAQDTVASPKQEDAVLPEDTQDSLPEVTSPETTAPSLPRQSTKQLTKIKKPVKNVQQQKPKKPRSPIPPEPEPEIKRTPKTEAIFQAIGMIQGEVKFKGYRGKIVIDGKDYPLIQSRARRSVLRGLKKEIAKRQNTNPILIVYPKIAHPPGKNRPHNIAFEVVAFRFSSSAGVPEKLKLENLEFRISGLWQFVPISKLPCISVYRNHTEENVKYLENETDIIKQVKFLAPSHIPIASYLPIKPFQHDQNKSKSQKPFFIQAKFKFVPDKDAFEFESLLAPPVQKAPKFLKLTRKAKKKAQKAKKKMQED